jgi:hypothetical protein
MAYHPQTDGQSECTNQWLEQYLRIYGNYKQDDWASWLPMVQYVHNAWPSATTQQTLFELLMGHTPKLPNHPITTSTPLLEERQSTLKYIQEHAQQAIKTTQHLMRL